MKVALVVGHKKNKPGACNEKHEICEFEFNSQLANDISEALNNLDIDNIIVYRTSYSKLPKEINDINPDFIVSFHCNAFNRSASGCEALFFNSSSRGEAIAEIFVNNLVAALDISNRGIKPKTESDRGGHLLANTKAPCIICEPFFIDNDSDLESALENYEDLVAAYVLSITEVIESW